MNKKMETSNKVILPIKDGWYWIKIKRYCDNPKWFPCYYRSFEDTEDFYLNKVEYFSHIGYLDNTSVGLDEIVCVGPEITEPNF